MVTNVTSLTGNGLRDWLVQRVTALYFAGYCLFIFLFILVQSPFDFIQWQNLFHHSWFKITSIVALVAFSLHAWIGLWTVTTDYVKCTVLRLAMQVVIAGWLSAQFIWGLLILWGQ